MRALSLILLVGAAAMLAAGCGPKKEEMTMPEAVAPAAPAPEIAPVAAPTSPVGPVRAEMMPPPPAPKVQPPPPPAKPKVKTPKSAAEMATKEQHYKVKAGDTLSSIAKHFYGNADLWKKIADANKDKVHDKDKITVGETLTIPAK
jgi:nucleoid-associated protein YgaU